MSKCQFLTPFLRQINARITLHMTSLCIFSYFHWIDIIFGNCICLQLITLSLYLSYLFCCYANMSRSKSTDMQNGQHWVLNNFRNVRLIGSEIPHLLNWLTVYNVILIIHWKVDRYRPEVIVMINVLQDR